jgi:hypothetical protein
MEINRYHVFCNTAQRSSGTSNDFSIALNPPFVKVDPHSYFVAQIVSVEIPYSWFQVTSSNNTLQFYYTVNGGAPTLYSTTIDVGNYTVTSLIANYSLKIESVLPAHTWSHNLSYNADTNKITFGIKTASAYTSIVLAINFPANNFLARMFGCLGSTSIVYGYASSTYQNVNASTNCNVNPVSSIYIRSSNLRQVRNQENMVAGYKADPSDILCKLQVYTPPKSYIFYNGELGLTAKIVNPVIDKIDLYLSDNYSFALDMNNNDWTFRITFIEYMPFNLGDGYQQTKHLNGKFNNQAGSTLNEMATDNTQNTSQIEPEQKQQDVMKTKKFQRE